MKNILDVPPREVMEKLETERFDPKIYTVEETGAAHITCLHATDPDDANANPGNPEWFERLTKRIMGLKNYFMEINITKVDIGQDVVEFLLTGIRE